MNKYSDEITVLVNRLQIKGVRPAPRRQVDDERNLGLPLNE